MKRKLSQYRCDLCGRQLPVDRWIFSTWTRSRYCWPTECKRDRQRSSKRRPQEVVTT